MVTKSNINIYNTSTSHKAYIKLPQTPMVTWLTVATTVTCGKNVITLNTSFKHQTKTLYLSVYLPHDIIAYENKQTKSLRLMPIISERILRIGNLPATYGRHWILTSRAEHIAISCKKRSNRYHLMNPNHWFHWNLTHHWFNVFTLLGQ